MHLLEWLIPWEFSPAFLILFFAGAWLFWRGCAVHRVSTARKVLFWSGMVILYLTMHTQLDYYAERMFFIHRLQHLVLHHLGPLLIMAAYPGQAMRAGLPMRWRVRLRDFRRTRLGKGIEAVLTNRILVPFLFVILVIGFLIPTVQFYSMLDWRLYRLMNWSVVISGFMYWNLILDRRPSPPAVFVPWGARVLPDHHHGAADHRGGGHHLLRNRPLPHLRPLRSGHSRHDGCHRPGYRRAHHVGARGLHRSLWCSLRLVDGHAVVGAQPAAAEEKAGSAACAGHLLSGVA